jgi:hypothetical protein
MADHSWTIIGTILTVLLDQNLTHKKSFRAEEDFVDALFPAKSSLCGGLIEHERQFLFRVSDRNDGLINLYVQYSK